MNVSELETIFAANFEEVKEQSEASQGHFLYLAVGASIAILLFLGIKHLLKKDKTIDLSEKKA